MITKITTQYLDHNGVKVIEKWVTIYSFLGIPIIKITFKKRKVTTKSYDDVERQFFKRSNEMIKEESSR